MASMLDRAIAAIGDFNNPFYAEERQRDVANEAAAFGFWVLFWTLLIGAGAICWVFPEHYMTATVLAVWVLAVAGLTSVHARRLGVRFSARDRNAGYLRRLSYGLVGAWLGTGWAHARFGVPTDALGVLAFFIVVFAVGLAVLMAVKGQLRRSPHR
jgi:hypothetical protein